MEGPVRFNKLEKPLPYFAIRSVFFMKGNLPFLRSFVNTSAMKLLVGFVFLSLDADLLALWP